MSKLDEIEARLASWNDEINTEVARAFAAGESNPNIGEEFIGCVCVGRWLLARVKELEARVGYERMRCEEVSKRNRRLFAENNKLRESIEVREREAFEAGVLKAYFKHTCGDNLPSFDEWRASKVES